MVDTEQEIQTANSVAEDQPRQLSLATHLLVLAGYAVLTVMLTYPVAVRLSSEVAGGGDAWNNLWNLWWVKQALVDRHTNPFQTDMLYYPGSVSLYLHTLTLTAGLISIPFQLLGLNLIATYNLLALLSFVLAGYGTFLLCHYLTANRWASFAGGIVFAFAPYHFAHLLGHLNLVSLQWIPFYVLVLLKTLDTRVDRPASGLGYAAVTGALLALNSYTDWLYALLLVLLTALLVAWRLLVPSERRRFRDRGTGWAPGALRAAVGAAVFFLLTAPILLPAMEESQQGYAQQSLNETLVYSSDVMLAFTPSELHPVWGKAVADIVSRVGPYMPQKGPSETVVFLGYSVIGLAVYAWWRLRANRHVRFWLFAAITSWVLSLGPQLQLFGKSRVPLLGVTVPLPYALLYRLPLFSIARTPSRITVLTMLALSVIAALALSALLAHVSAERRNLSLRSLVAAGLPLLILFEFLPVPFPTAPPGWDVGIYQKIAAEPGRFALLELPLRPVGDYMAYQTLHGKPIIGGFLARQPPYPLLKNTPVLTYLLDETGPYDPLEARIANGAGVKALKDMGVKYVLIHWWLLTPDQKKEMEAKLAALLPRPPDFQYPANQVAAWQLSP